MNAQDLPDTRASLLLRLQNKEDRESWRQFVSVYRPLVYRLARQRGLQDADAQDLAQRVLMSVATAIGDWQPDRSRAKFRTWLMKVASNAITDRFRRIRPDEGTGRTSVLHRLGNETLARDDSEEELAREYERQVFRWAAQQVREDVERSTWDAFWLTVVEEVSPADAAKSLRISIGSVYTSRSRMMKRIKAKVNEFNSDHHDEA